MRQRLLLAVGAALVLVATGLGVLAANLNPRPNAPFGIGMMGGSTTAGGGMMGGYGPGGMMGRYVTTAPSGTETISMDQAQRAVEQYVASYGGSNLVLDELIEFQNNFYAIVKEQSTGVGAFELLVDPVSGAVAPEPGPNLMWNTRYGMMAAGMMGIARSSSPMTVSADQAGEIAQAWLDSNRAGAKTETPDAFYGYYTVHFTENGEVAGMLSVNGYTGQVWFHSWHGSFVQERQVSS